MKQERVVRIAIQKRGRLTKPSIKFLASFGLEIPTADTRRSLVVACRNRPVSVCSVRDNDIPRYVSRSAVDFGIVGLDVVKETRAKVIVKKRLGFCKCRLVIAVPAGSSIKRVRDLQGRRIATSYPHVLKEFLKKRNIRAKIVFVEGSVEVTPYLKAAAAVCDITQTGKTLREFNLVPIQTILTSEAVLIESPTIRQDRAKTAFLFGSD